MKVVVLYRPKSEHGRIVDEFIREFQHRYEDHKLDIVDVDSRDGVATASLYDVVQYPSVLVLQSDGYLSKMWSGDNMPLMQEVAYYAGAQGSLA